MTGEDEREEVTDSSAASDEDPLAAIVPEADSESARDALVAEGVLDPDRKLVAENDGTVAIPVTRPPEETDVREVVRQTDPDYRVTGLADLLRQRGFTDAEVDAAPGSWAVVGTVLLADFADCDRPEAVGEALLELHGEADTVLDRGGISGQTREPDVTVVAGEGDTETVHTEHGTRYALDLAEVMFAPGNKAERARMGEVVEAGERVFDMYAGIGYFALPMARAGAEVTAAELNPEAFRYLLENAALNDVRERLDAYRGDCADVARQVAEGDGAWADRVVMGHYDAHERLETGLESVVEDGMVHFHAATPEPELWKRPERRVRKAAEHVGRSVTIEDRRKVKTHSEGVWHVVLDFGVD